MIDFFKGQMDYIYFFYGLAFLMLGGACLVLVRRKDDLMPWLWMGLFGITHALHEWTDILEIGLGNSGTLEIVRVILALSSFVFLVEFARDGLLRLRGRGPGRWIFIPLLILTAMGSLAGWSGLHAASRYTFGLLGCAGSGYVMLLASRRTPQDSGRWLIAGSAGLFAYAIASIVGVPSADFFPASVINEASFFSLTGIPIQLVRGVVATMTAMFIWTFSQTLPMTDPVFSRTRRRHVLVPVVILLLIIGAGGVLTEIMGDYARREELADGDLFVGIAAHHYESELEDAGRAAAEKSDLPVIVKAAVTGEKKDLEKADLELNQCIYGKTACREVYFMLDRKGKVILRCPRSPGFPDHGDVSSTALFKEAIRGKVGSYFDVDRGSGRRNLYVGYPVRSDRGEIVGVVGVRRDVRGLESAFMEHPYCFMVDADGTAFLSSRADMRLKRLWKPLGPVRQTSQTSAGSAALPQEAVQGDYVFFNNEDLLVSRRPVGNDGWSIVLLSSTSHIRAYRLFSLFVTFVVFGVTFAFFGILYLGREAAEQIATSERRYRSLVQGSSNGVMLFDHEGRCLTVNNAGIELLGSEHNEIVGRKLEEFCSEGSRSGIRETLWRVMKGQRCSLEIEGLGRNGQKPVWNSVFNPIYDHDGEIRSFVGILMDMTARKQAELRLRASEQRFRSYFELSLIGVAVTSPAGEWIEFNDKLCTILGYSRQEMKGLTWEEVTHPGDRAADAAEFSRVQEGGSDSFSGEKRFIRKDGSTIFVNVSSRCVRNAAGKAEYFVVLVEDVTGRKSAETALARALDQMELKVRERTAELSEINRRLVSEFDERRQVTAALEASEERFHSLFNLASDCIFLMEPREGGEAVIVDANIAACAMHGYKREELIGKPIAFLNEKGSENESADQVRRLLNGERVNFEIRHMRKDGSVFPVEVSAQTISIGGKSYILGIDRDITERKRAGEKLQRSEERYRRLVALSPDGIGVRSGTKILFMNTAGAQILGTDDPASLVGRSALDFIHPRYRNLASNAEERILANLERGEPSSLIELKFLRVDGSVVDVEVAETLISYGEKQSVQFIFRDISERKKAEEELQQALARLADEKAKSETIISALADGVSIQSPDFRILYQNEVHKAMVGEYTGEICYRKYARREEVCEGCPVELSFRDGRVHTLEKSNALSGRLRHIEIKASPMRDSSGKIIAGIELVRDITERRKAEENLKLFSEAVEEAMDGIQIVDLEGRVVYSNRAVEEIYGFRAEELLGAPVGNMNVDPDIADKVIMPALRDSGRWSGEVVVKHKSGGTFPVWLSTSLVRDQAGKAIATVGIIRDMTERKRTEEELQRHREHLVEMVEERTTELRTAVQLLTQEISFRKSTEATLKESEARFRTLSQEFNTLLDAIPDTLLLLSRERRVLWANKAAVTAFGREISAMIGEHCYTLWHDNPISCEDCHVLKSFQTGGTEGSRRTTIKGTILDSRAFPIKDEKGNVISVIVIVSDVTEKTTLQAEAMRASHLASLGELAAGVAHEINNPINGIINYAQLILNKMTPGTREQDISRRIIKEGDRIAGIVKSLLSFARERKEELTHVNLQMILVEAITLTEAQIRKDGIVLSIEIPQNLPMISANAQQIQQVFLNVISNARYALNQKYPGTDLSKKLTITAKETRVNETRQVRLAFHDLGTGISSDLQDKVMDPFFSTKPSGQGTGLGLSISHGIVKNHGGKLTLESVEGEYTKVIIDLPVREKNGD